MKVLRNWKILFLLFVLATVFVTFNSVSTSPLYHGLYIDSQIFQYMGFAMAKGKIPYVDVFDHKGLLLYFYNYVGYLINAKFGVLMLQIISMMATLYFWYRTFSIVKSKWERWGLVLLSLVCVYPFYWYGNYTQEWALPFISYPYMVYIENLEKGRAKFNDTSLLVFGLCIGCILSLQVNSLAPLCGLLLYCAISALVHKEYGYLLRAFILIFMGTMIPITISLIYMYVAAGTVGVNAYIYANLIFNLEYSADGGLLWQHLPGRFHTVVKALLPCVLILSLARKKPEYVMPVFIGFIFCFFTLGVRPFPHYQLVFIPLVAISIAYLTYTRYKYVALVVIGLYYGKTWYAQLNGRCYPLATTDPYLSAFRELVEPIPVDERDSVWNVSGLFLTNEFRRLDMCQMNRVIIAPKQISMLHPCLYESECNKIQREMPKYAILAEYAEEWMNEAVQYDKLHDYKESEADRQFVLDNYDCISFVKWSDGTKLFCYRRRE